MDISGIVLAGGNSKRMGMDKTNLFVNGKTLLINSIQILSPFCSDIIISSNNKEHEEYGTVVPDLIKDIGPMGGIFSCLPKVNNDCAFVLSCDAPNVNTELLQLLVLRIKDFDACVPLCYDKVEPLIGVYSKKILSNVKEAIEVNNYKMHQLLETANVCFVDCTYLLQTTPDLFKNLNRPGDL